MLLRVGTAGFRWQGAGAVLVGVAGVSQLRKGCLEVCHASQVKLVVAKWPHEEWFAWCGLRGAKGFCVWAWRGAV